MGAEDDLDLPPAGDLDVGSETNDGDSQPSVSKDKGDIGFAEDVTRPNLGDKKADSDSDMEIEDLTNLPTYDTRTKVISHFCQDSEIEVQHRDGQPNTNTSSGQDLVQDYNSMVHSFQLEQTSVVAEVNSFASEVPVENGCTAVGDENPLNLLKRAIPSAENHKRAKLDMAKQQPSVHINYSSLTRSSKQKLEELLQQWSQWHVQHCSSPQNNEVLETGEETFFPALLVDSGKTSTVSFWLDNQMMKQQKDFIPLDCNSVPSYDRGFTFGLSLDDGSNNVEGCLEIVEDASRCFNCGSYNHALRECPKPRDHVAVNNARQQHKSKRNQSSASRNSTRYYQNTRGGKYDDLKPGILNEETRKLLGLREFDPPPWLNRMRELGYPPGYFDTDSEDEPSGITMFGDDEIKIEQEDGEIVETDHRERKRKMTVGFPGINAPIPENADERLWTAGPSSAEPSRTRSHHRSSHHLDHIGREHLNDQRRFRDHRDEWPSGTESGFSTPRSSYTSRHGGYDTGYYSHEPRDGTLIMSRSSMHGRSNSDRYRSHFVDDIYFSRHSYSSFPFSPPRRR